MFLSNTRPMDLSWLDDALRKRGRGAKSELASKLGLQPAGVTALLRGDRNLKMGEDQIIADYLGMTLAEFREAVSSGRLSDRQDEFHHPKPATKSPQNERNLSANNRFDKDNQGETELGGAHTNDNGSLGTDIGGVRLPEHPIHAPSRVSMPRDLPVFGTAAGSKTGAVQILGTVDYVRRAPALEGSTQAYAVYVVGDSMSPWKRHGALAIVHPGRPVSIGDHVLVEIQNGEEEERLAYIKLLVRRTQTKLVLGQYNPDETFEVPAKSVISVHRILDEGDLLGV